MTYGFIFFILFIISTSYRNPFKLLGVRPMLFIPALTAVAVLEDERLSSLLGAFSGILLDSAGSPFFGFYTIQLTFTPYFIAVLCCFLLRKTRLSAFVLSVLWAMVFEMFYYVSVFFLKGGDFIFAFIRFIALRILYTSLFALPFYWLFSRIKNRFEKPVKPQKS